MVWLKVTVRDGNLTTDQSVENVSGILSYTWDIYRQLTEAQGPSLKSRQKIVRARDLEELERNTFF